MIQNTRNSETTNSNTTTNIVGLYLKVHIYVSPRAAVPAAAAATAQRVIAIILQTNSNNTTNNEGLYLRVHIYVFPRDAMPAAAAATAQGGNSNDNTTNE